MAETTCLTPPGPRPAWPVGDGWFLVGSERAWRLDEEAPNAEKHYFMIMRPDTPHWRVGLFTPNVGDGVAMWLKRLGYTVKPDFRSLLAQAVAQGIPVGMLQFAVTSTQAGHMKAYHATDKRGENMHNFSLAWHALHAIHPGLAKKKQWHTPIEGIASRGNGWELYTQPGKNPHHKLPEKTLHKTFTMLGAVCRQYSLDQDGTQTWFYTNMEKTIDTNAFLSLLQIATPLNPDMVEKVHAAHKQGAVIGDLIVQSPKQGIYHPVADMLWPVNGDIVFAP